MDVEAEVLYDMSKEFDIFKEQCLFQHNMLIDSNNQIYICLQDKIYIISLRKIALNKCILQDVIDCTKMIYNSQDKVIQNHYIDEVTQIYNSKSDTSDVDFAKFVLKGNKVNTMKDTYLRQRLVTINNDLLALKIKNFRISKYGLLPDNHPIITILLSNGDAYNLGFVQQNSDSLKSYQIIENLNEAITGSSQSNLEVMTFEWSEQYMSNFNVYQLLAIHASDGYVYLYKYENNKNRVLIDKYNVNQGKCKQICFTNYIENNQQHIKLFILSSKDITVVHLQSNIDQLNGSQIASSIDNKSRLQENNQIFKLIETKHLDFQFIDRMFVLESKNGKAPILYLAHNQEIHAINPSDYSLQYQQPMQSFNNCLGKVLAIFESIVEVQYQIFNEKSQIQTIKEKSNSSKDKSSQFKIEQEVFEEEQELQIEDEQNNLQSIRYKQDDNDIQNFSSSMFLPYSAIQSVNQCFYIVCGAHSFTSQQLSNILIINDSDNISDPYIFVGKCIKNLEKSVYLQKNELDNKNSVFAMMPFNWDDILFYIMKNQNEFVDILKISLYIYDQQKGIKKLQQDPQLEKLEQFLKNINISSEKLSFINEKLLLFLTSMQKQQFKDFIEQQIQAIIKRNYESAFSSLRKNYNTSNLLKRLSKEVDIDIQIQKICLQANQSFSQKESITCILTNLDIVDEPILKCKNCKNYMIDLENYVKQDPSNQQIQIFNVFQFRNNICPLCCGLVKPVL
ncbi:hypothetical protein TTHERM_00703590 (macronuclear) [Tetrahymena thermophila SB210]|uniref:Uncharacterized protein n=1 Tax=Tetrahymena thermophila (strain SB210) TaxID=312017 RepID=Q22GG4_TETTS|nr:hypothetical protein TTHERM_00703590 [Tetrahymena thermophila SB210]EAR84367.2 hypothetical protein TTHERM_00703590 [Tetrahymena thermophila SB210]|eukprot:XP_001032030.2 hypothetical protein TTHERM_00703590 [Tetrahymena thermophila SB210]